MYIPAKLRETGLSEGSIRTLLMDLLQRNLTEANTDAWLDSLVQLVAPRLPWREIHARSRSSIDRSSRSGSSASSTRRAMPSGTHHGSRGATSWTSESSQASVFASVR